MLSPLHPVPSVGETLATAALSSLRRAISLSLEDTSSLRCGGGGGCGGGERKEDGGEKKKEGRK
jgi:hypothetical protein